MKPLYRRLSEVGLTREFVKKTALPSWWEDDVATNPAGYAQLLLLLSRHLGLELRSLQDESTRLRLRDFGTCKFKKRADVSEDELLLARVMATRAAQLAAEATTTPLASLPENAEDIHQQILGGSAPWVGLAELLDWCWSAGIPVLHLDHFPKSARRPDGFAVRVHGRPVIVLCQRAKFSAWLLFILAHELGHIALNHITEDGALVDDYVDDASLDVEEQQANAFAEELLTGQREKRFMAADRWPMTEEFADSTSFVGEKMADQLDWSRLPEDSREFLLRVSQMNSAS